MDSQNIGTDVLFIEHRVNNSEHLKSTPSSVGIEFDVRSEGGKLILNHDPFSSGEELKIFLDCYSHKFAVVNIKETGIENRVINLLESYNVREYLLLDCEFPYIMRNYQSENNKLCVRFSELEAIDTIENFLGYVSFVWIDCMNKFPITEKSLKVLNKFYTFFVCPSRWNRPNDIPLYCDSFKRLNFTPYAIMTENKYINIWKSNLI